jgi:lysophospholipase L1-like esterase
LVSLSTALFLIAQNTPKQIRIACVGDSITAGVETYAGYPIYMQQKLGNNYSVKNFGVVAATVMLNTIKPYLDQPAFQNAKLYQPDIVVIMLGTNDAHILNYPNIERFKADYEILISETRSIQSRPRIFLVKPPPIFQNDLNLSNTNLIEGIIPRIEEIANEQGLQTIDVCSALINHPEYFIDGVHPNKQGSEVIAETIYPAIISDS